VIEQNLIGNWSWIVDVISDIDLSVNWPKVQYYQTQVGLSACHV